MFDTRKALGVFLIVVGVLFLLANNNLLWFGWEALWPIVPFILGLALMGMYRSRRKPRQLFVGTLLLQFGALFFLFSSGMIPWFKLQSLWPAFPLILGASVLLSTLVIEDQASPLILGFTLIVFAVVSFLFTTGAVESRAAEPVIRFWPLMLVAAGGAIVWRARRDALAALDKPADSTPES